MGQQRRGRFLGLPYDWRRPSRQRLRERALNPDEPRVFTPKSFGWGYGINFSALKRKLTGRGSSGGSA
jgi:hypothetical protein